MAAKKKIKSVARAAAATKPAGRKLGVKSDQKVACCLVPAASSTSALNYYAAHDEERKAASSSFRKLISRGSSRSRK